MSRPVERTYVENPDAYLDTYRIEDALRDLGYNADKIKNMIEASYPQYPAFLKLPTMSTNSEDSSLLDITSFIGIDADRNPVIYDGASRVSLGELDYDTTYWVIARIEATPADELRRNKKQNNRQYKYIIREDVQFRVTTVQPTIDLILGKVVVSLSESSEIIVTPEDTDRSPLIPNIAELIGELEDFEARLDSKYLFKERYDPQTKTGGEVVRNLAPEDDIQNNMPAVNNLVAGLNDDGSLDSSLLNIPTLRHQLSPTVTLDGSGAETVITVPSIEYLFTIWNGEEAIWGKFAFTTAGDIYELEGSEHVYGGESPGAYNYPDTLFLTSSLSGSGDGSVEIRIRNNYTTAKSIRYNVA